jgi:hypothetical protein
MDLAETFLENKAKNVGIALANLRLFNAIFWKKINKSSRITIGSVLIIRVLPLTTYIRKQRTALTISI